MMAGTPFNMESDPRSAPKNMGKRVRQPGPGAKFKDPKALSAISGEDAALRKAMASITPFRMMTAILMLGVFGYLYISHVFYMQQLHTEVSRLRNQYEQVRIDQHNTQLTYERLTGPSDVYHRARQLGLIDGGPADKILHRNP